MTWNSPTNSLRDPLTAYVVYLAYIQRIRDIFICNVPLHLHCTTYCISMCVYTYEFICMCTCMYIPYCRISFVVLITAPWAAQIREYEPLITSLRRYFSVICLQSDRPGLKLSQFHCLQICVDYYCICRGPTLLIRLPWANRDPSQKFLNVVS